MKVEITYKYDSTTGIFHKIHRGDVSFDDIINSWNELIGKNTIPDGTCRFLLDYLKSRYLPAEHGVTDLVKFYKAYDHIFANSKIAVLMDKPDQIIIPILMDYELPTISFKPFCTYDAAISWLLKDNTTIG